MNEKKRIKEISDELSITNILDKKVSILSGGQRQRVAIARSIINDPHIILMDEMVSSLNPSLAKDIINFIVEFARERTKTIVLVTHNTQNLSNTF